jgi:hypothetical protein
MRPTRAAANRFQIGHEAFHAHDRPRPSPLADLPLARICRCGQTRSRTWGDLGWSELVRQLEYKAQWYGRTLTKCDQWFPSSELCSCCGEKALEMPLKVRAWTCSACGVVHDRDHNAALNIDAPGQAVRACGGDVRRAGRKVSPQPPMKQETLPDGGNPGPLGPGGCQLSHSSPSRSSARCCSLTKRAMISFIGSSGRTLRAKMRGAIREDVSIMVQ